MAVITSKSTVVAAKIETTFNVAETLTNADCLEVKSSSKLDTTLSTVERDVVRNSMLSLPPIPVRKETSGNLDFELVPESALSDDLLGDALWEAGMGVKEAGGLGTGGFIGYSDAGTTPADMIYLADVAETGTATVYLLGGTTAPTKSLTVKEFVGTNKSMTTTGNVIESIDISLPTADIATVSFKMSGCSFTANESDTKLTPTCSNVVPYLGKSAVFKFDGIAVNATDVSVSITNTIFSQESLSSDGYSSKTVTGKDVKGSFTVMFEDYSMLTKFQNSTDGSLYIQLTQGTNKFAIYIPKLRLTSFSKATTDGIYTQSVDFQVLQDCSVGTNPIIIANMTV